MKQASSCGYISNRLQIGKAIDACLWQGGCFSNPLNKNMCFTGLTKEKKIKFKMSENLIFVLELINMLGWF